MPTVNRAREDTSRSPYAKLHALPLGAVQLEDGFWKGKQATNYATSLIHGYRMLEQAGNLHNLRLVSGQAEGDYRGRLFLDENVYKWLEAVAYGLAHQPDAELQQMADEAIGLIAAAQQPDGYLNSYFTVVEPQNRWSDLDHGHELYCAGHFFQAAIAFSRALGDTRLLAIATRLADHIDSIFGPGKREGAPGHPEPEMALVELYRETGEKRYLELSRFFIGQRGKNQMRGLGWYGPEYHQDRVPIRDASVIEGHAVRALYLMSGVTDLYLETGEQALFDALMRLWHDMTSGKLHITGGAGARYEGESFGDPYELPNDQCYCETCAAIASIMWNWRLLLATGEARFADLMEQTLYNGFLSGPALDGTHFFYINPLLSRGGYARAEWYSVACCPPNIMRTLASIEGYMATTSAEGIQLHLYHAATIAHPERDLALSIATEYPWEGQVSITVTATDSDPWALGLRIPIWCQSASLRVNGEPVETPALPGSYTSITRAWQTGDVVTLDLPMPAHLVEAHPLIDTTRGATALQRGPVLYCLEQVDHDFDIMGAQIDPSAPMQTAWRGDLLGGVKVITATGYSLETTSWGNQVYRPLSVQGTTPRRPVTLTAVPYHVWGNRGENAMRVWIPRGETR